MTATKVKDDSSPSTATLDIFASDVTGTQSVDAKAIQSTLPVSAVTTSLAALMQLPENVPWGLRDDLTSRFLDDERSIGDQLEPGSSVTVTPKTHLG
jgi:hypothetical protein